MSSKPEPVIWSHDTGQQIPCFDRCQLTITYVQYQRCCKPKLQALVDLLLEYGCHVSQVCHFRHRAHMPMIHATSHADHEKRVAWFSISMHACGSLPIVMVLCYMIF